MTFIRNTYHWALASHYLRRAAHADNLSMRVAFQLAAQRHIRCIR